MKDHMETVDQIGGTAPEPEPERPSAPPSHDLPADPIPALPLPVWVERIIVIAARALIGGFLSRWLGGNSHGSRDLQSPDS